MFFYIGNNCELLERASAGLFLDKGWTHGKAVWYKGYSTECNLSESTDAIINGHQPRGIWALIHYDGTKYNIHHSDLRGFPLYANGDEYTNIPNLNGFEFVYNNIDWSTDYTELSLNEVVDEVTSIFLENLKGFVKYNANVKLTVLATGGLDSTLAWAALDSVSTYDLVRTLGINCKEYDSTLIQHMNENHWAYKVINVNNSPTWNLTGFAAEVMTIRGYDMFNCICRTLGTTVYDLITPLDYMYFFLQRKNIRDRLNGNTTISTNLRKDLLSHLDSDYYMWHLDNNFHFSPFYDKRIPELCVRLSIPDLIENCKNGTVERLMLEKINIDFLSMVSRYKNYGNVMKNYDNNVARIQQQKS